MIIITRLLLVLLLGVCLGNESLPLDNTKVSLLCCRELHTNEVTIFSLASHYDKCRLRPSKNLTNSIQQLLLLLSGSVEINPGPSSTSDQLNDLLNSKGIKFIHQNIRGLYGKREILQTLFNSQKCVVTLSETHITSNDSHLFEMQGFHFISKNRQVGEGGGVAMYISDDIAWKRRHDLERDDTECLWIEIDILNSKNLLVGCMYRPPDSSAYLNKDFNNNLDEMLSRVNNNSLETFLLGDINANYLQKASHKELKNILSSHGLKQLVKEPTRVTKDTKSLIDVILTNSSHVQHTKVIPLSVSDHDCIGCTRKINHEKIPPRTVTCRDYSKYNPFDLSKELDEHDWEPLYSANNVNTCWSYLKDALASKIDRHAPKIQKRIKGQFCPWLSPALKTLMNTRDKLQRKARKSKSDLDWSNYKTLRNKCNNKIKRARNTYYKHLIRENQNNPAKFWKCIKEIFPANNTKGYPPTSTHDKQHNTATANSLCSFFTNVASSLKHTVFKLRNFVWEQPTPSELFTNRQFKFNYVSRLFVEKQLKLLKRKSAAGWDDLPPGIMIDCAKAISGPLAHIINLSLTTGTVPSDWKVAKVTPIHKGGSKEDFNNFRPISVLPVLSKILEKAVHHQLIEYVENLLSKHQFGYRKKRSTELATILLSDSIRKEVDKGKLVGAVFVDLSKAFDTLSHSVLLRKLELYGINRDSQKWFCDYLFDRKQFVVINDCPSKMESMVCGVPQGSVLGPLLFLLYFNDLENHLQHVSILNFADDTVIYVAAKTKEDVEYLLNKDLENMRKFFTANELVINLKKGKTESMLFGTSQKLAKYGKGFTVKYDETVIQQTDSYKYLGTVLDSSLSLRENFDKTYKKCMAKLRLLKSISNQIDSVAKVRIYKGMILPCLTFNCTVNLNLNATQERKLKSIDKLTTNVLGKKQTNSKNEILKHSVVIVRKCLDGMVCENFDNYFEKLSHRFTTRNNKISLKIPVVKLKYAKSGFFSMGTTIYNNLPIDIRSIENFNDFRNKVLYYFRSTIN